MRTPVLTLRFSIKWADNLGLRLPSYSTKATYTTSGTSNFGTTWVSFRFPHAAKALTPSSYYHTFSTAIPATGISSFTITINSGGVLTTYTNGGKGYPVEDNVIFLREGSSVSNSNVASISVAVCKPINDPKHRHC